MLTFLWEKLTTRTKNLESAYEHYHDACTPIGLNPVAQHVREDVAWRDLDVTITQLAQTLTELHTHVRTRKP